MTFQYRALVVTLLSFFGSTLKAEDTPTSYTSPIRHFDLPAQHLSSSLIEFGIQAEITVIVDLKLVEGYNSPFIIGPLRTRDALQRLLRRSPLNFFYHQETDSYYIVPGNTAQFESDPIEQSKHPIEEIPVFGRSYPFRYQTLSNSQIHSGVSSFDSSRLHSIFSKTFIEDQNPLDVLDIIRHASGISPGDGFAGTNDDFFIRGFQRHSLYVDGYRIEGSTGVKMLTDNIEQAEILKGPSTIRYGQGEPGGIVNLVRKKPLPDSQQALSLSAGNYKSTINADLNQAKLTDNVNTRIVASFGTYEDTQALRDIRQFLIAPSLRWQFQNNTIFDLSYEYQQSALQIDKSDAILDAYAGIFDYTQLDEVIRQATPDYKSDFHLLQAEVNHFFDDNNADQEWKIRGKFFWQEESRLGVRTNFDQIKNTDLLFRFDELGPDYFVLIPGGQVTIPIILSNTNAPAEEWRYSIAPIRGIYDESSYETGLHGALALEGSMKLGTLMHHLTTGVDVKRQDVFQAITIEELDLYPFQSWNETQFIATLAEIFNTISDETNVGALTRHEERRVYDEVGVFLQDDVELTEHLMVSLGARYIFAKAELENITENRIQLPDKLSEFTSQFGFSYGLNDKTTIFGSYSEGIRANYYQDFVGNQGVEPEYSQQWELGLKAWWMDGRLLASIASYNIQKQNILGNTIQFISDTQPANAQVSHDQQTLGLDLDLSYQANAKTQWACAISLMNPEITSGNFAGYTPTLTTKNSLSLFVRHQLFDQIDVKFGARHVGKRFGDDDNQFKMNSYTILDAGLTYKSKSPLTLSLTLNNATDEQYYSAVVAGVRANEGERRSISVKATLVY